jgi:hypothetical protein
MLEIRSKLKGLTCAGDLAFASLSAGAYGRAYEQRYFLF